MSLDRIEVTPFAVIVGQIFQDRGSGSLTVAHNALRKVFYWSQGELVMATSTAPEDAFAELLVRRRLVSRETARELFAGEPVRVVANAHESGLLDLSGRQSLLREWLIGQIQPLFDLEEGTAAFNVDDPLPPDRRVFLQSTPAAIIAGVRSITNGLVLRRSLGDLQREIQPARESRLTLEALPLTDQERAIAGDLQSPTTIDALLKRHAANSVIAGKVVIAMMAVGLFSVVTDHSSASVDEADMQRDMEILAAIGASDPRALRAVAYSRQLGSLDHYQVLDVPRAANRAQITAAAEALKKTYDPSAYPQVARDSVRTIVARIHEAMTTLNDPSRRTAYDRLIQSRRGEGSMAIQQQLTRRSIADQNFIKAKELTGSGDYYGAIVLLRQAVHFAPDFAAAWHLLGACEERNPRWRRDAAESFQRALSIDPNNVEVMISLGDLYKSEGLITRAQTCYEDALKIDAENQQARSRLKGLKK